MNDEKIWLLKQIEKDYKQIIEFAKRHSDDPEFIKYLLNQATKHKNRIKELSN